MSGLGCPTKYVLDDSRVLAVVAVPDAPGDCISSLRSPSHSRLCVINPANGDRLAEFKHPWVSLTCFPDGRIELDTAGTVAPDEVRVSDDQPQLFKFGDLYWSAL